MRPKTSKDYDRAIAKVRAEMEDHPIESHTAKTCRTLLVKLINKRNKYLALEQYEEAHGPLSKIEQRLNDAQFQFDMLKHQGHPKMFQIISDLSYFSGILKIKKELGL